MPGSLRPAVRNDDRRDPAGLENTIKLVEHKDKVVTRSDMFENVVAIDLSDTSQRMAARA